MAMAVFSRFFAVMMAVPFLLSGGGQLEALAVCLHGVAVRMPMAVVMLAALLAAVAMACFASWLCPCPQQLCACSSPS